MANKEQKTNKEKKKQPKSQPKKNVKDVTEKLGYGGEKLGYGGVKLGYGGSVISNFVKNLRGSKE
jgi:hypothetical protein